MTTNLQFEPFPLKPLFGLDSWYADIENLTSQGGDSLNIPGLLEISVSIGNATTEAISRNAVVFCEPEWGEVTGAGVGSMYGNGGTGSGEGGLYVSW